ncbi:T9SS type A sorting domain-containing protein [Aridibaculum aurantiacum]|uniref:T9SS type A sorting domain-containing protein n=1 Tax=Aridibaculum aurantiacum TaxID=2810307 RepID=UPI001A95FE58|nr:T9SS type A sorting domain-containing protein [Aridibaculum aurantiacum]
MQGTYTIGTGGNYTTLTSAFTALRTTGVGGPVILELLPGYVSTGETFPINPGNIPCVNASRTITVRPQAGANNLSINSSMNIAFSFANTRYVKIDGRAGGTGTTQLNINSSSNLGSLMFNNGAQYDTVRHVNITGVGSATAGIISFTTTTSISNSFNAVQNCIITSNNGQNCIYALGSTGNKNTSNTISNCDIRNYGTNGVWLRNNNTNWTIRGNSFYHTTGGGPGSSSTISSGIFVDDSTSGGFVVTDNFIGGSAAQCGGNMSSYSFRPAGIRLNVGRQVATSVQNNTITNIRYQNYSNFEYFVGIELDGGKIHCGTTTGNTIGSTTTSGAIKIFSSLYEDPEICGIRVGTDFLGSASTLDTILIQNNKIGGFVSRYASTSDYMGAVLYGIKVQSQASGFIDIGYNLIGSQTVFPGMDSYRGIDAMLTGIYSKTANSDYFGSGYAATNNIHDNELVNFQGKIVGIDIQGGKQKVYNNTLRKFYMDHNELSATGIRVNSTTTGTLVKGNKIHSFTIRNGYSYGIEGIFVGEKAYGCRVEGNFIHSFQRNATWDGGGQTAIFTMAPAAEIVNNMIRLGRDTTGSSPNPNPGMNIIGIEAILDSTLISNNTVYIDATNANTYTSYCLKIESATAKPKWIINNILVNHLPCTTGSWCQHAPFYYGANVDTAGLQLDYNIYHTTASIPYGIWNNQQHSQIADWRAATRRDQHSMFTPVNFVNGTGGVNNVDLHLTNPTPAEGTGIIDSRVLVDFDQQQRAAFSPADIGADAGNFVLIDGDVPVLTHGNFIGQHLDSSQVYPVKITDNGSGIDTTGGNKPRMWFRKKHPSVSNWFSTAGTLESGNLFEGNWNFIPDLPATGLSFSAGDSLEYYFVAQDKRPLLGYSNTPGTNHTSVNTQLSAPTSPLQLLLYGTLPDTINIGTGEMFTSLTNDDGFFQACRKNIFKETTTKVVVYITSDLAETGKHRLELLKPIGPRIEIKTPTPTLKQVRKANLSGNMIDIYHSPNVHLDGSVNGSGRYLLFGISHTNPQYTSTAIRFFGKLGDVTVNSCIFESNSNYNYIPALEVNATDTTRKVLISNNLFREATNGVTGLPKAMLSAGGSRLLDSFVIRQNEFINFGQYGVSVSHNNQLSTQTRMFVDSNHFYYTTTYEQAGDRIAINASSSYNQLTITNNFIGGTQKFCGGNRLTGKFKLIGINLDASNAQESFITNNTIQNISLTDFSSSLTGINLTNGMTTVKNNLIGHPTRDSSIMAIHTVTGIGGYVAVYTNNTPTNRIENNTVAGAVANYFYGINFQGRKGYILNNRVFRGTSVYGGTYSGMKIWLDTGRIEGNHIYALKNINTNWGSFNIGLDVVQTAAVPNKLWIAGNRIHGLSSKEASGSYIAGIRTGNGEYHIYNNQVSLDDASGNGKLPLYGLYNMGAAGNSYRSSVRYNTVRIAGNSTAAVPSYAMYIDGGGSLTAVKNNLFYNERTTGINKNLAVGMVSTSTNPVTWIGAGASNNLYVTADTARVNEWRSAVVNIFNWRASSGGDTTSFAAKVHDLPASALFVNAAEGNLNINTHSPLCWYLNGKGVPQADYAADFDSVNIRSTSITDGPTDIGSDEFNTTTAPPLLTVYGRHKPGGADTLSWNGRIVGVIEWSNTGSLPTIDSARWYSGVWPNDTTNGGSTASARYWSSYVDMAVSGGSGYQYKLTLFYDSSMLGKVQHEGSMVLNKKQHNVPGTWQAISPTIVNTAIKTVSIANQSSFSEFTATDAAAPLPVHLLAFDATTNANDVLLNWKVVPADEHSFVVQRSYNGRDFQTIATAAAVAGKREYSITDAAILRSNNKTIYYRLETIEKSGDRSYSNTAIVRPQGQKTIVKVVNPFSNTLALQLKLEQASNVSITLTDMNGRICSSYSNRLGAGDQLISLPMPSAFATGVYTLRVEIGDKVTTMQLLKSN